MQANQYYEENVNLVVKCQTAIRGKIARTQLRNARNYTRDVEAARKEIAAVDLSRMPEIDLPNRAKYRGELRD